ncbi:MAG: hypothetical protein PHI98_14885 [Eubacteriales bacterium]|nr:hypothetical protein [Eubacteriales bacterium]
MKAVICDRCEKIMTGKKVEEARRVSFATEKVGVYLQYHLCEECEQKLIRWIQGQTEDGEEHC